MLTGLAAVFGLGFGMIIRHSAAAITTVLVWAFVIENLIKGFAPPNVSRFLPFSAANGLLDITAAGDNAETMAAALTRVQDALLFWRLHRGRPRHRHRTPVPQRRQLTHRHTRSNAPPTTHSHAHTRTTQGTDMNHTPTPTADMHLDSPRDTQNWRPSSTGSSRSRTWSSRTRSATSPTCCPSSAGSASCSPAGCPTASPASSA